MMEALLRLLPPKPQPLWVRYGSATLLVAIFFLLRVGLQEATQQDGFFLLFPAVFLPAILFDRGSGFYASALSTLLMAYVLAPEGSWRPANEHLLSLVSFLIIAILIVFISEGMRKALEQAVDEREKKELLLQEMSHRFKNNLTIAVSIFRLQARSAADEAARAALTAASARLTAIADAHAFLMPAGDDGVVPMQQYLEHLCQGLGDALRDVRPVAIRVDADDIEMPTSRAVPIGLIANELVTNAIKYAFPEGRSGVVAVSFKRRGDRIELVVSDDGIGCPPGGAEGTGTKVTRLLVGQLGGTVQQDPTATGCRMVVAMSGV